MTDQQVKDNLEDLSAKVSKLQQEVYELKQKIKKSINLDVPEFMRDASITKR